MDEEQAALGRGALALRIQLPDATAETAAISLSAPTEQIRGRKEEFLGGLHEARDRVVRDWQAREAFGRVGMAHDAAWAGIGDTGAGANDGAPSV